MARRAFAPPSAVSSSASASGSPHSKRDRVSVNPPPPSVPPPRMSSGRGSVPPPGPGGLANMGNISSSGIGLGSLLGERSLGSLGANSSDAVNAAAVGVLIDRLLAMDDAPFLVSWLESMQLGRQIVDVALTARLVRAYREAGRPDRARDLAGHIGAQTGANAPNAQPVDVARLAVERAFLAIDDNRPEQAEAELRQASRALASAPRGTGAREQLDVHLASAQLELRIGRSEAARASLRLAEHVAERLEDGVTRVPVALALGHLSIRLSDPRAACKHYAAALERAPARSLGAMRAHGNLGIALSSVGRFDEARQHANVAITIAAASELHMAASVSAGARQADAHDVLAMVEIMADHPMAALHALDEAWSLLADADAPQLRLQLAQHRAWALALAGRAPSARQWLTKVEELRVALGEGDARDGHDVLDEQDYVMTRARTLEAAGELEAALAFALPHTARSTDAFVTGVLNLIIARCADSLGETVTARAALERAAVSGDKHGWIFPERLATSHLWDVAAKGGDSRVVRYAEQILSTAGAQAPDAQSPLSVAPPSLAFGAPSLPPASMPDVSYASLPPRSVPPGSLGAPPSVSSTGLGSLASLGSVGSLEAADAEALLYVTTPHGVSRVKASEVRAATAGAQLVVDTRAHQLRVADREVSLERRRALEPLVVQLLRRAREGLSAEEILRAAGGPGPESADAEHRVRVLISRVRDLLGDPAAIERVRDAGEYGKTRYRLASGVHFALVEPLFSPSAP